MEALDTLGGVVERDRVWMAGEDGRIEEWPFVIEEAGSDSLQWMWIGDGSGSVVRAPTVIVALLGRAAEEHTSLHTPEARWGWDFRQGRLFLMWEQGFSVLFVTALSALLFAGLVGWSLRYRRRFFAERAQREALMESRRRLADSREEERLRIARDLHDGPVQDLHALRMRLTLERYNDAPSRGSDEGYEEEVTAEMQHVINTLRAISEQLRPPALGPFGLAAALRAHAARFQRFHAAVTVEMDLDDDAQHLPEQVRLVFFRIAQESMNNAVKHGNPSRIDVAFRMSGERVLLSICDDGKGFHVPDELNALAIEGHYGLLGMSERAGSIGAELDVKSAPGHTCVRIEAERDATEWSTPFMRSKL